MPYCTVPEQERHGGNAKALAGIPEEDRAAGIEAASEEIDSYLRERYTLPLVTVGKDIMRCCAVMSVWHAITVRGLQPGRDLDGDPIYKAYLHCLDWLKMIAERTVTPNVVDSSPGASAGATTVKSRMASNVQRGWQDNSGSEPFSGRRQ